MAQQLVSLNIAPDYSTVPEISGNMPTIYLNAEQCEALGIEGSVTPGTVIGMMCRCVVTDAHLTLEDPAEGENESYDTSLCLNITDAAIMTPPSSSDAAKALYGKDDAD